MSLAGRLSGTLGELVLHVRCEVHVAEPGQDRCGDEFRTDVVRAGCLPGVAKDASQLLDCFSDFLGEHQADESGCAVTVASPDGLRDLIESFVVYHAVSLGYRSSCV